jgi:glycosyltransferase involved in cell wall biosynthesis
VRRAKPHARLILQTGGPQGDGIEHRNLDRHEDLVHAYREAHVTALASEGEAFGLVLVESLACGTPAVGASEASPLTFDGTAHDLARKILDAAWLDPANCREHAERFDVRRTARAHEQLYNDVLARHQR